MLIATELTQNLKMEEEQEPQGAFNLAPSAPLTAAVQGSISLAQNSPIIPAPGANLQDAATISVNQDNTENGEEEEEEEGDSEYEPEKLSTPSSGRGGRRRKSTNANSADSNVAETPSSEGKKRGRKPPRKNNLVAPPMNPDCKGYDDPKYIRAPASFCCLCHTFSKKSGKYFIPDDIYSTIREKYKDIYDTINTWTRIWCSKCIAKHFKNEPIEESRRMSQIKKEKHASPRAATPRRGGRGGRGRRGGRRSKEEEESAEEDEIDQEEEQIEENVQEEQPKKRRRKNAPNAAENTEEKEQTSQDKKNGSFKANFEEWLRTSDPETMKVIEGKREEIKKLEKSKQDLFLEQKKLFEEKTNEITSKFQEEKKKIELEIGQFEQETYQSFIRTEFEKISKQQAAQQTTEQNQGNKNETEQKEKTSEAL